MREKMYFKEVPRCGDLGLMRVLLEFEGSPVVSIMKNDYNEYFIYHCTEIRSEFQGYIIKATTDTIVKFITKEITLADVYLEESYVIKTVEKQASKIEYSVVLTCDVDDLDFPPDDWYLEFIS